LQAQEIETAREILAEVFSTQSYDVDNIDYTDEAWWRWLEKVG
jgi:hypothetical protein